MKSLIGLLMAASLLLAADAVSDSKADQKKLQGTWKATSAKFNGKDSSVDGDNALAAVFKDNVATLRASEAVKKAYAKVQVKLDASTMPKCIDITVLGGTQKDTVFEGIYKFDGDKLVLCVKLLGKERPTKFESPEGENIVLMELEHETE